MEVEKDEYLEHYGVQGMKWGVRKATNKERRSELREKGLSRRQAKGTVRYQNRVDKQRMAATGRQGKVGALKQLNNRMVSNMMLSGTTALRHPLSTQKAATRQLEKNTDLQRKIGEGKKRVTATLIKLQGVSIKDIDYST